MQQKATRTEYTESIFTVFLLRHRICMDYSPAQCTVLGVCGSMSLSAWNLTVPMWHRLCPLCHGIPVPIQCDPRYILILPGRYTIQSIIRNSNLELITKLENGPREWSSRYGYQYICCLAFLQKVYCTVPGNFTTVVHVSPSFCFGQRKSGRAKGLYSRALLKFDYCSYKGERLYCVVV